MLKDVGINWVILGHSERRHVFGESNTVSISDEDDNDLTGNLYGRTTVILL